MDRILEEIQDAYRGADVTKVVGSHDELMHYGMPRRSGRYPWGSGEDPYQHTQDFAARVELLKKSGWKETAENIKSEFKMTTNEYRAQLAFAKDLRRVTQYATICRLKDEGLNMSQIAKKLGVNESTLRGVDAAEKLEKTMQALNAADFIGGRIDELVAKNGGKAYVDVGDKVNLELGISHEKMEEALSILKEEGYVLKGGRVADPNNPGKMTTLRVVGPSDTPNNAAYDYEHIHSLNEYTSHDGGDTFDKFVYPASISSSRIRIRYADEAVSGEDRDGLVQLRRGVDDISLGESHYSQVRILVDGTHYIKGMAVYSDDLPPGVDILFNTNKTSDVPMCGDKNNSVLKPIKHDPFDPDNPFGSAISPKGQSYYFDPETGERKLRVINKRADEGDWNEWKDKVPSQFLSKQPLKLAQKQLGIAVADKQAELDSIMALTNPVIKKHLLGKFADACDSAAENLGAAPFPGQKYRVILPLPALKEDEVYCPQYENGTQLALVRYPHAGTFEIPLVTVNNKHPIAKKELEHNIADAIAISPKTAARLSGADFDGDTVMCIPTRSADGKLITNVKSTPYLQGLIGFDPKLKYKGHPTGKPDENGDEIWERGGRRYKIMSKDATQMEMGKISNLITDMQLSGASPSELERAVKHSMVVIDAAKHKLDWQASEIDNNIAALKKEYQTGGASTLISRAKGKDYEPKTQGERRINIEGKKWYDPNKPLGALIPKIADDAYYTAAKVDRKSKEEPNATVHVGKTGKRYVSIDGSEDESKWIPVKGKSTLPDGGRVYATTFTDERQQRTTKMAKTDDARTLISDKHTDMEEAYAAYANSMKQLARDARVAFATSEKVAINAQAKRTYAAEVQSLEQKIRDSERNAPRERAAKVRTQAEMAVAARENPNADKGDMKKAAQRALSRNRVEVGSVSRSKREIEITDREWEAIQAGAVSSDRLKRVLNNANIDKLRERATPKDTGKTITSAQKARIKAYSNSGLTNAEIAAKFGISPSTVSKYLKEV